LTLRYAQSSQSHPEADELREAKLEKNSSALLTTETQEHTKMHGEPLMPL